MFEASQSASNVRNSCASPFRHADFVPGSS